MSDLPRVAAVVLLRRDGAALLQHRDDTPGLRHAGMWVPPGGHCEGGEDALVCAQREFFEETAYRAGPELRFLMQFVDDNVPGHRPQFITVFWAWYDGVQQPVCHEGQGLAFIERHRAAELLVPGYLVRVWDAALAAARDAAPVGPVKEEA
jgi:8-oxo-dGTP pyrophosphatase MutT (NUDIX family)